MSKPGSDLDTAIPDLLADLAHALDRLNLTTPAGERPLTLAECFRIAEYHYQEETLSDDEETSGKQFEIV